MYDYILLFCFFKQKTAYEMSISDWSSDVCSSDLRDEIVVLGIDRQDIGEAGADADGARQRQGGKLRHHAAAGDQQADSLGGLAAPARHCFRCRAALRHVARATGGWDERAVGQVCVGRGRTVWWRKI